MKPEELKDLVSEAMALDRAVKTDEARLKAMKREILEEALRLGKFDETDGGGLTTLIDGNNRDAARAIFPGDKLKSKIDPSAKTFAKIEELAGKSFAVLFDPSFVYTPTADFRNKVRELIVDGKVARKLLNACQSDSEPSVKFETK